MATQMPSSLEIAQEATPRPIAEIAEELGLQPDEYDLYGKYKAKVDLSVVDRLADRPDGKLVCVTAITPTKAGEGKTTTSVSLTQGLGKTELDGFLVSTGWGTYGFKAAPIVGTTLAELVATGETPELIAPFALERFHTDTLVSELAAAAVSHYDPPKLDFGAPRLTQGRPR